MDQPPTRKARRRRRPRQPSPNTTPDAEISRKYWVCHKRQEPAIDATEELFVIDCYFYKIKLSAHKLREFGIFDLVTAPQKRCMCLPGI